MGWASSYIGRLRQGESVQFRPTGNSMTPKIKSGQLVTVVPVSSPVQVGDVVLCKVKGAEYLHLVKATKDGRFQIGNAHGHVNGWTGPEQVFGKVTKIET